MIYLMWKTEFQSLQNLFLFTSLPVQAVILVTLVRQLAIWKQGLRSIWKWIRSLTFMHNLLIMVRLKLKEVSRTISKKSLLNEHQTRKHLYNFQASFYLPITSISFYFLLCITFFLDIWFSSLMYFKFN